MTDQPRVLPDLQAQLAQAMAQMAQMQAKMDAMAAAKPHQSISFKVSEKGCVSIYGLGRFPVTAYASQWERILAEADKLKAFIAANADTLKRKA